MDINVSFKELASLVQKMGATPIHWGSNANRLAERDIPNILLEGLEINREDLEVTKEGLLKVRGEHVLLYIKDTNVSQHINENEPENSRRFHISDCSTIETKKAADTFERYIVTTNVSGVFKVDFYDSETDERGETTAELKVCKNCLSKLNYQDYKKISGVNRQAVWENFSIKDFFDHYKSIFKKKPNYTDKTAPSSGYSENWSDVSTQIREANNWTCSACSVDLSKYKKLLHVHHKNGVKSDNSLSNLETLCAVCHSDHHGHMGIRSIDRTTILRLRKEHTNLNKDVSGIKIAPEYVTKIREKRYTITKEEARQALINLRSQIKSEVPNVAPANGVLRKNMMKQFLEDKVSSMSQFNALISENEINKTDKRHFGYLNEIFKIVDTLE